MDIPINLTWFAAPILAQRNIELASISTQVDMFDGSHVFILNSADGTMGEFKVSRAECLTARNNEELAALLSRHLETVEFTSNGQPTLLEIQPPSPEPSTDSENTEPPADAGSEDGSGVETPVDEGSPEPTPAT
jgi:hypothetical protein